MTSLIASGLKGRFNFFDPWIFDPLLDRFGRQALIPTSTTPDLPTVYGRVLNSWGSST